MYCINGSSGRCSTAYTLRRPQILQQCNYSAERQSVLYSRWSGYKCTTKIADFITEYLQFGNDMYAVSYIAKLRMYCMKLISYNRVVKLWNCDIISSLRSLDTNVVHKSQVLQRCSCNFYLCCRQYST